MANITTDIVFISDAESVTGWSGDSFALEPEIKVEGSNSVAVIQTGNGANPVIYSGSWNMSGKQVRLYMSSNIMPNTVTKALNGIEITLSDGSNTARWTVGGSDTYSGGWVDWSIDPDSTPTSGSVNTSAVTDVSIVINTSSKPRNATNGWYDNWRFGNGLVINSSTTEVITFKDVADTDVLVANAWDIIQDTNGVLFARGSLTLGSTGSLNCNLVSVGETLYFQDDIVSSTLYKLISQQGSGATDIDISGMTCKTVGTSQAEIDFSSTLTSLSVKSSSFTDMGTVKFNSVGTISSNTFTNCNEIDTQGATFSGININGTSASTGALNIVSSSNLGNMSAIKFTSMASKYAVYIPASVTGTITLNNFQSDGTGTDVYWAGTAGALTINKSNGTNLTTTASAGGTVDLVSSVSISVHVADEVGADISGALVYIDEDLGAAGSILNTTTNATGDVSTSYSGAATSATVRVRKYGYKPYVTTISLTADSATNVTMITDPQQN